MKIFCIGLHKTGTSSLHELARHHLKSTHSTDWGKKRNINRSKLDTFQFFCDGGSHFDGTNHEFDVETLYHLYPDSRFILTQRDVLQWVISKCQHAGWNQHTVIQHNNPKKIQHKYWKYKSLLTVQKFIEHYFHYNQFVLDFWEQRDSSRLLVVDLTTPSVNLTTLCQFMDIPLCQQLPHKNKNKRNNPLHSYVQQFMKAFIEGKKY